GQAAVDGLDYGAVAGPKVAIAAVAGRDGVRAGRQRARAEGRVTRAVQAADAERRAAVTKRHRARRGPGPRRGDAHGRGEGDVLPEDRWVGRAAEGGARPSRRYRVGDRAGGAGVEVAIADIEGGDRVTAHSKGCG